MKDVKHAELRYGTDAEERSVRIAGGRLDTGSFGEVVQSTLRSREHYVIIVHYGNAQNSRNVIV